MSTIITNCGGLGVNFAHLFVGSKFDTIRAEPLDGLLTTREALPMRREVSNRKVRDLSNLKEVFNPHTRSTDLRFHATYCKDIPRDLPLKCQLPETLAFENGRTVHRPAAWH